MSDNCHIPFTFCDESIFIGDSWRCNDNTSTTTTQTSTTTTTTSSTTTTTTTEAPQVFTIINNSEYDDLEYFVFGVGVGTPLLCTGFVQSGQTRTHNLSISGDADTLTIWVKQLSGELMYIEVTLAVTGEVDQVQTYSNGTTEFQYNDQITTAADYTLTIEDTTPATTTTSTTSTTTSTSTTTTTSTSTSSTTTTTTTESRQDLDIVIMNIGTPAIGFNTRSWNIDGMVQSSYYNLSGGALTSGQTQTPYSSMIGTGNQTRLLYENTGGFGEVFVSLFWSNNNGASFTNIGSFSLAPYSGVGAYPFNDSVYNTPQSTTQANILQVRVTGF